MASEYLLKKYKDVKPDEVRVLTKEEKRRNWWDYHKYHVVIGAVLLLCLGDILWHALGFGQVKPDISVAYIGSNRLSQEDAQRFVELLESSCPDMNGDGRVTVSLLQYNAIKTGDSDSLYYAQAAQVQLVSDVADCTSFLFLMEDPAQVQESTSALSYPDGSLPREGDLKPDGKYLPLSECPALSELADTPAFANLSIARRGFWTDKTVPNLPQCEEFWNALIG